MKAYIYAFDEVDRPEEVAKALTDLRQEIVNEVEALREELKGCQRAKPTKPKKKGFVMKKLLPVISILVIAFCSLASAQYVKSDINYDIASNPESLSNYLRDTVASGTFEFTPMSAPAGNDIIEGKMYYDSSANALYVSLDGSNWTQLDTAGGTSLDASYNLGSTIDVDTSALTFTTSNGDNNVVMVLAQNEADNDNDALTITFGAGAIGTGVVIDSQSSGTDISGDNWSIDQAGKLTILEVEATGDFLFKGTTYDIAFDASREGFVVEDNAIIGFGAGAHNDPADLTISGDGTNVLIEAATQDGADWLFGSTNALDVKIMCGTPSAYFLFNTDDSAKVLTFEGTDARFMDGDFAEFGDSKDFTMTATNTTFTWQDLQTNESSVINIGADQDGIDLKLFGATTGAYSLWSASNDALWLEKADIALGDGDAILFGDTLGTGDFTISATSAVLNIDVVAAGVGAIEIGNDADDVPLTWWGETTGANFILTGDTILVDGMDMTFEDGDFLKFGDGSDFTFTSATDKNLVVAAAGSDELYEFHIGIDQAGVDLSLHGTTAGDIFLWDASDDYLHMIGDKVLFTLAEAAQQFQVDATGTVTGDAIVLSTTDGGILFDADGGTYGDINLNAEDDITITVADDLVFAVSGLFNIAGSVLTNTGIVTENVTGTTDTITAAQSGSIIVYTMSGAACEATLPAAAAGLWFILIDGNPAAGRDLKITPVGDDGINGDTATNYILNENDRDGEGVVIFATSATEWFTMACGSSTVWTEQ